VAIAFAHTFWWAIGAILIAFIPTLFLPNRAAVAAGDGDGDVSGEGVEGAGPGTGAPIAGALLD
jgi:hypothetical protein